MESRRCAPKIRNGFAGDPGEILPERALSGSADGVLRRNSGEDPPAADKTGQKCRGGGGASRRGPEGLGGGLAAKPYIYAAESPVRMSVFDKKTGSDLDIYTNLRKNTENRAKNPREGDFGLAFCTKIC